MEVLTPPKGEILKEAYFLLPNEYLGPLRYFLVSDIFKTIGTP